MKNYISILLTLFASLNIYCQDSLGRMNYFESEKESKRCIDPAPSIQEYDTLILCVFIHSQSAGNYDDFCASLNNNEIKILKHINSNENENQAIVIQLTAYKLKEKFKGIIKYNCVPASSFDGYIWQQKVDSYVIPEEYKHIIDSIYTTDPQTGGC